MFKGFCCAICSLLLFLSFGLASRKVSVSVNPGCSISQCKNANSTVRLVYTRSQGESDCIHYLWSVPGSFQLTLLVIRSTDKYSTVVVDWPNLVVNQSNIEGSIKLSSQYNNHSLYQDFSTLYILQNVYEYNDTQNSASITDQGNFIASKVDFKDLLWNVNVSIPQVHFEGHGKSLPFGSASSLAMNFQTYVDTGREHINPHLAYNDHSSLLEVVLDNLTSSYAGSRFAIGIVAANAGSASFSSDKFSGTLTQNTQWNIDDEYTPSIFTTEQLLSITNSNQSSFWQWKTICYTNVKPTKKYSSDVVAGKLTSLNKTSEIFKNHLLLAYYGRHNLERFALKSLNVSFGKIDDGFYLATNYTSWTSLIGVGSPPQDTMSIMVISIIFTALGCPILVIVLGALFLTIKHCRNRKRQNLKFVTNYAPIE